MALKLALHQLFSTFLRRTFKYEPFTLQSHNIRKIEDKWDNDPAARYDLVLLMTSSANAFLRQIAETGPFLSRFAGMSGFATGFVASLSHKRSFLHNPYFHKTAFSKHASFWYRLLCMAEKDICVILVPWWWQQWRWWCWPLQGRAVWLARPQARQTWRRTTTRRWSCQSWQSCCKRCVVDGDKWTLVCRKV